MNAPDPVAERIVARWRTHVARVVEYVEAQKAEQAAADRARAELAAHLGAAGTVRIMPARDVPRRPRGDAA